MKPISVVIRGCPSRIGSATTDRFGPLENHRSITDDWATTSELAESFAVLSYAVEHGATGAAVAWSTIAQSGSYTQSSTSAVVAWQANPLWGIQPRTLPA